MSRPAKPPRSHEQKLEPIVSALRAQATRAVPAHIAKAGVRHVVPIPHDPRRSTSGIDISALDEILEIDAQARTCTAEPGVPFWQLATAALGFGLLPAVVPELEGITVGGAVAGCSVESTSFRHGGFHDSCLAYEVVTGGGAALELSPEREPFLFEMMHGSYGTLGVLTRLTFRLVPARRFVRLEYQSFPNADSFDTAMRERCAAGDYDFVDGIIHSPRKFVLCLGRFADATPYLSTYRRREIYYKSTARRLEDCLTTLDYCFRYDADCHWLTRAVPPLEWKPVRRLFGSALLGSTNLIGWAKRLEPLLALKRRPDVVSDVFLPARRFGQFYRWYERAFAFFPLWVVPYRMPRPYPFLNADRAQRMQDELFVDCAIYGKPNTGPQDDSKVLEDKVFELDGFKALIGRNHYTRERFWEVFNRESYEAAKARLDPEGVFPGIFEKLHRVE